MTKTNLPVHRTIKAESGMGIPDKFYVTIKLDGGLYLDQPIEEVEKMFDREVKSVRTSAFEQIKKMQEKYRNQEKFKLAKEKKLTVL